jgi:hypothetical protein
MSPAVVVLITNVPLPTLIGWVIERGARHLETAVSGGVIQVTPTNHDGHQGERWEESKTHIVAGT